MILYRIWQRTPTLETDQMGSGLADDFRVVSTSSVGRYVEDGAANFRYGEVSVSCYGIEESYFVKDDPDSFFYFEIQDNAGSWDVSGSTTIFMGVVDLKSISVDEASGKLSFTANSLDKLLDEEVAPRTIAESTLTAPLSVRNHADPGEPVRGYDRGYAHQGVFIRDFSGSEQVWEEGSVVVASGADEHGREIEWRFVVTSVYPNDSIGGVSSLKGHATSMGELPEPKEGPFTEFYTEYTGWPSDSGVSVPNHSKIKGFYIPSTVYDGDYSRFAGATLKIKDNTGAWRLFPIKDARRVAYRNDWSFASPVTVSATELLFEGKHPATTPEIDQDYASNEYYILYPINIPAGSQVRILSASAYGYTPTPVYGDYDAMTLIESLIGASRLSPMFASLISSGSGMTISRAVDLPTNLAECLSQIQRHLGKYVKFTPTYNAGNGQRQFHLRVIDIHDLASETPTAIDVPFKMTTSYLGDEDPVVIVKGHPAINVPSLDTGSMGWYSESLGDSLFDPSDPDDRRVLEIESPLTMPSGNGIYSRPSGGLFLNDEVLKSRAKKYFDYYHQYDRRAVAQMNGLVNYLGKRVSEAYTSRTGIVVGQEWDIEARSTTLTMLVGDWVEPVNTKPVAKLDCPQFVYEDAAGAGAAVVSCSAARSYDPNGDDISIEWYVNNVLQDTGRIFEFTAYSGDVVKVAVSDDSLTDVESKVVYVLPQAGSPEDDHWAQVGDMRAEGEITADNVTSVTVTAAVRRENRNVQLEWKVLEDGEEVPGDAGTSSGGFAYDEEVIQIERPTGIYGTRTPLKLLYVRGIDEDSDTATDWMVFNIERFAKAQVITASAKTQIADVADVADLEVLDVEIDNDTAYTVYKLYGRDGTLKETSTQVNAPATGWTFDLLPYAEEELGWIVEIIPYNSEDQAGPSYWVGLEDAKPGFSVDLAVDGESADGFDLTATVDHDFLCNSIKVALTESDSAPASWDSTINTSSAGTTEVFYANRSFGTPMWFHVIGYTGLNATGRATNRRAFKVRTPKGDSYQAARKRAIGVTRSSITASAGRHDLDLSGANDLPLKKELDTETPVALYDLRTGGRVGGDDTSFTPTRRYNRNETAVSLDSSDGSNYSAPDGAAVEIDAAEQERRLQKIYDRFKNEEATINDRLREHPNMEALYLMRPNGEDHSCFPHLAADGFPYIKFIHGGTPFSSSDYTVTGFKHLYGEGTRPDFSSDPLAHVLSSSDSVTFWQIANIVQQEAGEWHNAPAWIDVRLALAGATGEVKVRLSSAGTVSTAGDYCEAGNEDQNVLVAFSFKPSTGEGCVRWIGEDGTTGEFAIQESSFIYAADNTPALSVNDVEHGPYMITSDWLPASDDSADDTFKALAYAMREMCHPRGIDIPNPFTEWKHHNVLEEVNQRGRDSDQSRRLRGLPSSVPPGLVFATDFKPDTADGSATNLADGTAFDLSGQVLSSMGLKTDLDNPLELDPTLFDGAFSVAGMISNPHAWHLKLRYKSPLSRFMTRYWDFAEETGDVTDEVASDVFSESGTVGFRDWGDGSNARHFTGGVEFFNQFDTSMFGLSDSWSASWLIDIDTVADGSIYTSFCSSDGTTGFRVWISGSSIVVTNGGGDHLTVGSATVGKHRITVSYDGPKQYVQAKLDSNPMVRKNWATLSGTKYETMDQHRIGTSSGADFAIREMLYTDGYLMLEDDMDALYDFGVTRSYVETQAVEMDGYTQLDLYLGETSRPRVTYYGPNGSTEAVTTSYNAVPTESHSMPGVFGMGFDPDGITMEALFFHQNERRLLVSGSHEEGVEPIEGSCWSALWYGAGDAPQAYLQWLLVHDFRFQWTHWFQAYYALVPSQQQNGAREIADIPTPFEYTVVRSKNGGLLAPLLDSMTAGTQVDSLRVESTKQYTEAGQKIYVVNSDGAITDFTVKFPSKPVSPNDEDSGEYGEYISIPVISKQTPIGLFNAVTFIDKEDAQSYASTVKKSSGSSWSPDTAPVNNDANTASEMGVVIDPVTGSAVKTPYKSIGVGRIIAQDDTTEADTPIGFRVNQTDGSVKLVLANGTTIQLAGSVTETGSGPVSDGRAFEGLIEHWELVSPEGDSTGAINGYVMEETGGTIGSRVFVRGDARNFDGTVYFSSPSTGDRYPSNDIDWWVSIWGTPDTDHAGGDMTIIGKGEALASNSEWEVVWDDTGDNFKVVVYDDTGAATEATSLHTATKGYPVHIHAWWNPTAKTAYISVNDETPVSAVMSGTPRVGSDPLYIGSRAGSNTYNGPIQRASLWSRNPDDATERSWHNLNMIPRDISEYGNYVSTSPSTDTVVAKVAGTFDDAEELADSGLGHIEPNRGAGGETTGIRLGHSTVTHVIFRFPDIQIPKNANVTSAYLKLYTYKVTSGSPACDWRFHAEDAANAQAAADQDYNISDRQLSTAYVDWPETSDGAKGTLLTSPDISSLLEVPTSKDEWKQGNALALIMDQSAYPTSGERNIFSYDHGAYEGDFSYIPALEYTYEVTSGGTPEPEYDVDVSVTASANDGTCYESTGADLDGAELVAGDWGDSAMPFVMFAPAIPRTALIESAVLEFTVSEAQTGEWQTGIWAISEPTPSAPTDGENLWLRPRFNNGTPYTHSEDSAVGDKIYIDVSAELQKVVNLSGFTDESNVMFLVGPSSTYRVGRRKLWAYDNLSGGDPPRLRANYTYGGDISPPSTTTWVPSWANTGFIDQFKAAKPVYDPRALDRDEYVLVSHNAVDRDYDGTQLMQAIMGADAPPPNKSSTEYPRSRTRTIVVDYANGSPYDIHKDIPHYNWPNGGGHFIIASNQPNVGVTLNCNAEFGAKGDDGWEVRDSDLLFANFKVNNFYKIRGVGGVKSIVLNNEFRDGYGDLVMMQRGSLVADTGDNDGPHAVVGNTVWRNHNRDEGTNVKNVGQHLLYCEGNKGDDYIEQLIVAHNACFQLSGSLVQLLVYATPSTTLGDAIYESPEVYNNFVHQSFRLMNFERPGIRNPKVAKNTFIAGTNWETLLRELYYVGTPQDYTGEDAYEYRITEPRLGAWMHTYRGDFSDNVVVSHVPGFNWAWAINGSENGIPYTASGNKVAVPSGAKYFKNGSWVTIGSQFDTDWGAVRTALTSLTSTFLASQSGNWNANPLSEAQGMLDDTQAEFGNVGAGIVEAVGTEWHDWST